MATHVGEAVSPPIVYAPWEGALPHMVDWLDWLGKHWPNAEPPNRTNHTCGFHIHVSFHSHKAYTLLTSKIFLYELRQLILAQGIKEKLPRKHPFWNRVNGGNTFCHLDFNAPKQMEVASKDGGIRRVRYGWLNFASALHGTMEFRALPTFRDFPVAARFSHTYFTFIDSYLAANIGTELALERIF
jgi:hypothetical protein